MNRRSRIALVLTVCACAATPHAAFSQAYPAKSVRNIVTFAGGADVIARMMAQKLSESLGQPVVVDVQSGTGGALGAEMAARAAPDGYTILLGTASTLVMHQFLSRNTRFDPVTSYTPISKIMEPVLVVVSNPSVPVVSIKELIDYARRNPGKISYGTSGIGTAHHLSAELIRSLTGIDWVHVPYKGGPPVLTDLMTGRIQVGFSILATANPLANSGKIRILGVNNDKRYPVVPDIPTVSEQLAGYQAPPGWAAYFGPAGLPRPIAQRLNGAIVKAANSADIRGKAQDIGLLIGTNTPEEMSETIRRDIATTAKMVQAAGIKPE